MRPPFKALRCLFWVVQVRSFTFTGTYVKLQPRHYDGANTSTRALEAGQAGSPFIRTKVNTSYPDGAGDEPTGNERPSPRTVLADVLLGGVPLRSVANSSQALVYWGMLMLQDMVEWGQNFSEPMPIPCDDGLLDEQCPSMQNSDRDTSATVPYYRMQHTMLNGTRQPINLATAAWDLDYIYGRTQEVAYSLRTFKGGKMKLNGQGLPSKYANGTLIIADQRSARDPYLLTLHSLLLREHNLRCDELAAQAEELQTKLGCHPTPCTDWTEEDYYQAARMWTISRAAHITLKEWFPEVAGFTPKVYNYTSSLDPSVDTFFAAAANSWLWSALGPNMRFLDQHWYPVAEHDPLAVRDSMDPGLANAILYTQGLDVALRGMSFADAFESDASVVRDVTAFKGAGPAIDIQRCRDLGIPSYNEARAAFNLSIAKSFSDVTSDAKTAALLEQLYKDVSSLDAVVGGMAEDRNVTAGIKIGQLFYRSLLEQVNRTQAGDQFYHSHLNQLTAVDLSKISTLANRNSDPVGLGQGTGSALSLEYPVAAMLAARYQVFQSTEGEKAHPDAYSFNDGAYTLGWTLDEAKQEIRFTVKVGGFAQDGFIGFGLGTGMRSGADIFFTQMIGSTITVTDRYANQYGLPTLDTDLQGTNDLFHIEANRTTDADGVVWVSASFSRKLDTGDLNGHDRIISQGPTDIMCSYNLKSKDQQHSYLNNHLAVVDFWTGATVPVMKVNNRGFFALHGVVMLLAWGVAAPLAWYVVRYRKDTKYWLELHMFFAAFAAQASVPMGIGAIATLGRQGTLWPTTHAKWGMALLCVIILQTGTGYVRMLAMQNRGVKFVGSNYARFAWFTTRFHRYLGRIMIPVALYQIHLGLNLIAHTKMGVSLSGVDQSSAGDQISFNMMSFQPIRDYLFWIWSGLLLAVFGFSEYHLYRGQKGMVAEKRKIGNLPTLSMEAFHDRVLQGELWLIVDGMIVDMGEFIKVHPGGSKIMKESIGHDVTQEIRGIKGVDQGIFTQPHLHSDRAWTIIQNMVVGFVDMHEEVTDSDDDSLSDGGSDGYTSSDRGSSAKRSSAGSGSNFVRYVMKKKELLVDTDRPVYRFVFAPRRKAARPPPLRVGYIFKFRVIKHTVAIQRTYTPTDVVACGDGTMGYEFFIRMYPQGKMSMILAEMRPGDCINIQGPLKIEVLRAPKEYIYMAAGGTGISPMLQLVRYHLKCAAMQRGLGPEDALEAVRQLTSLGRLSEADLIREQAVKFLGAQGSMREDKSGFLPAKSLLLMYQTENLADACALDHLRRLRDHSEGTFTFIHFASQMEPEELPGSFRKRGLLKEVGRRLSVSAGSARGKSVVVRPKASVQEFAHTRRPSIDPLIDGDSATPPVRSRALWSRAIQAAQATAAAQHPQPIPHTRRPSTEFLLCDVRSRRNTSAGDCSDVVLAHNRDEADKTLDEEEVLAQDVENYDELCLDSSLGRVVQVKQGVVTVAGAVDELALQDVLKDLIAGVQWAEGIAAARKHRKTTRQKLQAMLRTPPRHDHSLDSSAASTMTRAAAQTPTPTEIQGDASIIFEEVPPVRPDNTMVVLSGPPRFTTKVHKMLDGISIPGPVIVDLD